MWILVFLELSFIGQPVDKVVGIDKVWKAPYAFKSEAECLAMKEESSKSAPKENFQSVCIPVNVNKAKLHISATG